jgi:hypothetical protein
MSGFESAAGWATAPPTVINAGNGRQLIDNGCQHDLWHRGRQRLQQVDGRFP